MVFSQLPCSVSKQSKLWSPQWALMDQYWMTKKLLHSKDYMLNVTSPMVTLFHLPAGLLWLFVAIHYLSLKTQRCLLSSARCDLLAAIFVMLKILRLLLTFAARIELLVNRHLAPVKTRKTIACVAAVSFPFPNAREREENCERVAK